MRRHRWELRAVPMDLDDEEYADTWRVISRAINADLPRFMLRRSAERAASFYEAVITGMSFYVVPAPDPARQEPQDDLHR